jgi:ferredoxin
MPAWTIEVDRDRCIGSGMCLVYAPGTFTHDEQTKAVVDQASTEAIDSIRTAVEACPTRALELTVGKDG